MDPVSTFFFSGSVHMSSTSLAALTTCIEFAAPRQPFHYRITLHTHTCRH